MTHSSIPALLQAFDDGQLDRPSTDVAAFRATTLGASTELTPFTAALRGGFLSDRLAWVFLAAYQSAQRSCFPGLDPSQWGSFAVSEDQSGEVPGTSLSGSRLSGSKSWIAASSAVDYLIVTIGPTLSQGALRIPVDRAGVSVKQTPEGAFLADIEAGRANFDAVEISAADYLDDSRAQHFGSAEPFFVMCSAVGYLLRECKRLQITQFRDPVIALAHDLEALHDVPWWDNLPAVLACYERCAPLGRQCAEHAAAAGGARARDWAANGKLLGMYGRGLRARVAALDR